MRKRDGLNFAILDKDFGMIEDGTNNIQRTIMSMCCRFPDGMRWKNGQLGEIFQKSASRISHLITDLNNKQLILIDKPKSALRRIYLNPCHPTLLELARLHEGELCQNRLGMKCLHCYFQLCTWLDLATFSKDKGKKTKESASLGLGGNKPFPEDTTQTPEESLRPGHWKDGHSYDCPGDYAEQVMKEAGL